MHVRERAVLDGRRPMRTSTGSLYYKGPPWDKWGTFHGISRWHGSTVSVLRFGSWQFYCDFLEVCPYFKERFYLNIWGAGEWTEYPVGNYFQTTQEKRSYLYWTCNFSMTITITTVTIVTAKEELVQEVRQRQQLNTAWSRVLLGSGYPGSSPSFTLCAVYSSPWASRGLCRL